MDSSPLEETRMAPVEIRKKHPLAIRWFHWIHFPVMAIMVWSGLLIYWANPVYRIGWGATTVVAMYNDELFNRLGLAKGLAQGMAWHFLFAWFFVINGVGYVLYTLFSGEWRHLLPTKGTLKEAWQVVLHDLRIRREPLPRKKFNGAQQIAYTSIVLLGGLMALTGLAIYKPAQLSWLAALFGGYEMARFFHFWMTVGFCLFFIIHILQVMRAGWNNFRAMMTGYELTPTEEVNS